MATHAGAQITWGTGHLIWVETVLQVPWPEAVEGFMGQNQHLELCLATNRQLVQPKQEQNDGISTDDIVKHLQLCKLSCSALSAVSEWSLRVALNRAC